MSFFEEMPYDLQIVVWSFAFFGKVLTRPIHDIEICCHLQERIPPIFLKDRIPWNTQPARSWQDIGPMNPFKKGNQYIPLGNLNINAPIFSQVFQYAIFHLLPQVSCRQLATYRGHLHNKVRRYCNKPVYSWNELACNLFMAYPGLEDPEMYNPITPWEKSLVRDFTEGILGSLVLSVDLLSGCGSFGGLSSFALCFIL